MLHTGQRDNAGYLRKVKEICCTFILSIEHATHRAKRQETMQAIKVKEICCTSNLSMLHKAKRQRWLYE